ncbi:MAG: hypothetical protein SGJ01_05820 [Gemmatimonadota bacterium]|nr:hypothetical protein [Gemmatimonadota bacterium]
MNRHRMLALVAALSACSSLTEIGGGVVALEVQLPVPAFIEPNDTVQIRARALNVQGDSVAATITWLTPDTTLVIDPTTGEVSTTLTSGSGKVQARVGSLRSDISGSNGTLTIRPSSDTLRLTGSDTVTVATGDTVSGPLLAAVESNTPAGGVANTTILFSVVDTASALGNVFFAGNGLSLRATTGSTGAPSIAVTLRRSSSATLPASFLIEVSATRPSGAVVAGSGQRLTVLFQ